MGPYLGKYDPTTIHALKVQLFFRSFTDKKLCVEIPFLQSFRRIDYTLQHYRKIQACSSNIAYNLSKSELCQRR